MSARPTIRPTLARSVAMGATLLSSSGLAATFNTSLPSGSGRAAILARRAESAAAAKAATAPAKEPTTAVVALTHLAVPGACHLLKLPEDLLLGLLNHVSSPLAPADAVGLSRCCCKSLRSMPLLRKAAIALHAHHSLALSLSRKTGLTLERLAGASRLSWHAKGLTAADMRTLALLAPFMTLEEVDLRQNELGDAGLHALLAASAAGELPGLRTLVLSNTGASDAGALALAAAVGACPPALAGLEQLSLEFNRIEADGMAELALAIGAGALPRLSACFLQGNPADDAMVQQALSSPSAARAAAGGGGYLGGMLGSQYRCCREARRVHRGLRFF